MAIFKNYYNRKPLGYIHKWCITVSCLMYLLSGRAEFAAAARRHVAKGPAPPPGDLNQHSLSTLAQIERNFVSETPPPPPQQQSVQQQQHTQPLTVCPNCLYKTHHHLHHKELKSETDTLRLEAIKTQILSKLGLRNKPNVSHAFPREVIMETLYRAEDDVGDFMPLRNSASSSSSSDPDRHHLHHHHESSTDREDTVDVDDFYGRTSKIISFAEQGYRVNGNRLLEFRVSTESGLAGQKFKVVAATLWLKADIRHPPSPKCKSTNVYVFNFVSSVKRSIKVNSKEFRELTEEPVATSLENPGWQKIDLTVTVRQWLEGRARESLRLFVDCSCCSNWDVHVFNGDGDRRSDSWNRPFLVVHTDPATAKRVKRRALDCSPDSGSQCCKQRFYVSFRELGWDDWIIAPKGYFANYCRGDCGHHRTPDSFVTYHTHVIEEVRKTHHLSGMQPCCAPLKFSSMSLIYFGPDSNIIKRDLPKMVVDECGCP